MKPVDERPFRALRDSLLSPFQYNIGCSAMMIVGLLLTAIGAILVWLYPPV